MCCVRAAPALLVHLNLLLAMIGGATLATSARLKWDPSTYVIFREFAPSEYRAAAALLPLAGLALLMLAHLAISAVAMSPDAWARRMMLLLYACGTSALVVCEVAVCIWAWGRVAEWLQSSAARDLRALHDVREHVLQLLAALAHWHPLPNRIREIIEEAEADGPRNGYCAAFGGVLLVVVQLMCVMLAVVSLRGRRRHYQIPAADDAADTRYTQHHMLPPGRASHRSSLRSSSERAPLAISSSTRRVP